MCLQDCHSILFMKYVTYIVLKYVHIKAKVSLSIHKASFMCQPGLDFLKKTPEV